MVNQNGIPSIDQRLEAVRDADQGQIAARAAEIHAANLASVAPAVATQEVAATDQQTGPSVYDMRVAQANIRPKSGVSRTIRAGAALILSTIAVSASAPAMAGAQERGVPATFVEATTPKTTPNTTPSTTPKATTPKATTPKATTPKATTPKATTPEATTPKATTPEATTPKATTPEATTPAPTTPAEKDKVTATTPEQTAKDKEIAELKKQYEEYSKKLETLADKIKQVEGGTPAADTAKDSTAPAKESDDSKKKKDFYNRAAHAGTVALATQQLVQAKGSIQTVIKKADKEDISADVNHNKHAMNSLNALGDVNTREAALGLFLGFENSAGNVKAAYNALHDRPADAELPQGVSVEEARDFLTSKLTSKNTDFSIETPTGDRMNHGQAGEDVRAAGVVTLDGTDRVFTVKLSDGRKLEYKLFNNNCVNILTDVEFPPATFTVSTPTTGGGIGGPNTNPTTGTVIDLPPKKKAPKTTGGDIVNPKKDHDKVPGKTKPNPGVAGVDRNPLTPDDAGEGAAGQTLDVAGFLPTETHPVDQAPKPTPAPVAESGPEPTLPATTGDLTPPKAPPVKADGADAPTPSQEVVIKP